MGGQIISGMVLAILAFMLISRADSWAPALTSLTPTIRSIINTLQGVAGG